MVRYWIMDDLGDDFLLVSIALTEIECAESGWTFTVVGVGSEDGASSLTLSSNHSIHFERR